MLADILDLVHWVDGPLCYIPLRGTRRHLKLAADRLIQCQTLIFGIAPARALCIVTLLSDDAHSVDHRLANDELNCIVTIV